MSLLSGSRTQGLNLAVIATGSLAACNVTGLIDGLHGKLGATVVAVLTQNARRFITADTLRFAGGAAEVFWEDTGQEAKPLHILLAAGIAGLIVFPASANFIGKAAHGLADDLASTLFLAAHQKPRLVIPSMNPAMWTNPVVQKNIGVLRRLHVEIFAGSNGIAPNVEDVIAAFEDVLGAQPQRR